MWEKKEETIGGFSKIISCLNERWNGFKPLFKLFSTGDTKFIYDTGTNKILSCEDSVYFFLGSYQRGDFINALTEMRERYSDAEVSESLAIIKNAIESEGILQTDSKKIKMADDTFEKVGELGRDYLPMVTLEVTSRCNMRCIYCIYNDPVPYARNHGPEEMSWEVAARAIDFLAGNSRKAGELFITFYGGEPLLNLKLIKKSVAYAGFCLRERPLNFSLTTNCTLVDEQTARFLAENNFSILASIDGPKEIHDNCRIDYKHAGTFDRSMQGLKRLVEIYGAIYGDAGKDKIALHMVFTPPCTGEKIHRISQFLESEPYLAGLKANISCAVADSMPGEKMAVNAGYENNKTLFEWAEDQFLKQYPGGRKRFLSRDTIEKSLFKLYSRPITDEPVYRLYPNGCCKPTVGKVFIEVDGRIRLCERIYSSAPMVGNVVTGIDFDLVKRVFVDEYFEMSNRDCAKCWVGRLCSLCYVDAFENKKFSREKKRNMCRIIRQLTERDLVLYSKLMRIDPGGLNYLADYKL